MINPRLEIKSLLDTLGYPVYKSTQTVFNTLPALTYYIADSHVELTLDRQIASQFTDVWISIWSEDGLEASSILDRLEELLRANNYTLTFSADVPNTDAGLVHISTRFNKTE